MSSNCIGNAVSRRLYRRRLQRGKTAVAIRMNVLGIVQRYGIERVGLLTLTFADGLSDAPEAQRRFKSFRSNVLMPRYGGYLRVFERTRRSVIHYHVLVPTAADIRTGYCRPDGDGARQTKASPALRAEWALLRDAAPRYGFGRISFEPILSSSDALAAYLAKTMEDADPARALADEGVRICEMSRNLRTANTHFSWLSPGATQWRLKAGAIAESAISNGLIPPDCRDGALEALHGRGWALGLRNRILAMPDIPLPSSTDFRLAEPLAQPVIPERLNPKKETTMLKIAHVETDVDVGDERIPIRLHALSAIFPKMADDEFDALITDIKANGLREPITLLGEEILDGGNRYRACIKADIEPRFVQFDGGDPVAFVMSKNLHRRHLSPGQQAVIVSAAQDWKSAATHGGDRKSDQGAILPLDRQTTIDDRAAMSGASRRTQKMADKVAREAPELVEKVAHGDMSLTAAIAAIKQQDESQGGKQGALAATSEPPDASAVIDDTKSDGVVEGGHEATEAGNSQPPAGDPRDVQIAELKEQNTELARLLEETMADNASMAKVFDANDQVKAALAQEKQQRDLVSVLNDRVNGLMNEKNQYVRLMKHWKRVAEKLEQSQRTAG